MEHFSQKKTRWALTNPQAAMAFVNIVKKRPHG
jgi:hypothetical protein